MENNKEWIYEMVEPELTLNILLGQRQLLKEVLDEYFNTTSKEVVNFSQEVLIIKSRIENKLQEINLLIEGMLNDTTI